MKENGQEGGDTDNEREGRDRRSETEIERDKNTAT